MKKVLITRKLLKSSEERASKLFDLKLNKKDKILQSDRWQEEWINLSTIKDHLLDSLLSTLDTKLKKTTKNIHANAYEYYLKAKYKFVKRNNIKDVENSRKFLQKSLNFKKYPHDFI